jgi:hypothetical protein
VIGVRVRDSEVSMGRLPDKLVLKFIYGLLVGETIPDLNSGLRYFRGDILALLHLLPDGLSASTTSTLIMMKREYRFGFVDIISI